MMTKRQAAEIAADAVDTTHKALALVKAKDDQIKQLETELAEARWQLTMAQHVFEARPATEMIQ